MTIARTLLDELACVLPERDEREAPRAVRCLEDELVPKIRLVLRRTGAGKYAKPEETALLSKKIKDTFPRGEWVDIHRACKLVRDYRKDRVGAALMRLVRKRTVEYRIIEEERQWLLK